MKDNDKKKEPIQNIPFSEAVAIKDLVDHEEGHVVFKPATVPHAVYAASRFKMLLTVVKQPFEIQGLS